MDEVLNTTFDVLVAVTVFVAAMAIGIRVSWSTIRDVLARRALFLVIAVNIVVVPIAGWVIVELVPVGEVAGSGLLLCAICAGGPLSLKTGQIARGDLSWDLGLIAILLVSNIVAVPLWSGLLMTQSATVGASRLIGALLVLVLLPVVIGMVVRRVGKSALGRWTAFFDAASNVTLIAAIGCGVAVAADELASILWSWAIFAIVAIIVVSAIAGFLVPGARQRRQINVLVTANRATSIALLVVGQWFGDDPEMLAVVISYGIVQTMAVLGGAVLLRRGVRSGARA